MIPPALPVENVIVSCKPPALLVRIEKALPFRRGLAVPPGLSVCGCSCEKVAVARWHPGTANRTMKSPRPTLWGCPFSKGVRHRGNAPFEGAS